MSTLPGLMSAAVHYLLAWNPLSLDPYNGVFGCFDLAALLRLPHLICLFVSVTCEQRGAHFKTVCRLVCVQCAGPLCFDASLNVTYVCWA